ncbi:hypothetical protein [Scandinavium manionii]|uniref:hypothetical protein n=1 Tax=Scandinavium manionii TaxID=2926520 RepID=UPI00135B1319|nr:hypothetical protein [Scandinavium manionii]MCS2147114.1 hypothetical protein [Scandinavium manionii]
MERKVFNASQQGDLDNLCGFYSVVNMMHWLYGNRIKRKPLFKTLVQYYDQHWPVIECLTSGMNSSQMDILLKCLKKARYSKYPITISQPFRMQRTQQTEQILKDCQAFLTSHEDGAILISDQYHWSVITHIDNEYLHFYDSWDYTRIKRTRYSLRRREGAYHLYPEAIYFIERSEDIQ